MGDEGSTQVEEAMELECAPQETFQTPPEIIVLEESVIQNKLNVALEDSVTELATKKRRKSRKKTDGYKYKRRVKAVKQPPNQDPDEYEVEMILDYKVDEQVTITI